jgi:hypothetical protein
MPDRGYNVGVMSIGRRNALIATALLALGLGGVALAGVTSGSGVATAHELRISVTDGKVVVSKTTLTAGKITLVVVNNGKKKHGLAIMGTTMGAKRTPTIAAGKTARLVVTLAAGKYHVWDPVTSSMSRAKYLTVKAPAKSGSSGTGSGGTGSSGAGSSGAGSGSTGSTGGGGGTTPPSTGMDPGMDGCDH